jgi:hypothetical protein
MVDTNKISHPFADIWEKWYLKGGTRWAVEPKNK